MRRTAMALVGGALLTWNTAGCGKVTVVPIRTPKPIPTERKLKATPTPSPKPSAALFCTPAPAVPKASPTPGRSAEPSPDEPASATATPTPAPGEDPTPTPPPADPIQELRYRFEAAQADITGFKARARTLEVSSDGSEHRKVELAFRRPALLAVHVLEATSEMAKGAYLLWDGSDSLKVKPTILPMAMTLALTDEHVVSKNAWTLQDVSVTKIINVLTDPDAEIAQYEDEEINGHAAAILEVRSAKSPQGVDHEVIGIDLETYLPVLRELWDGNNTLRYKLNVDSMTPNAQKDADFKI